MEWEEPGAGGADPRAETTGRGSPSDPHATIHPQSSIHPEAQPVREAQPVPEGERSVTVGTQDLAASLVVEGYDDIRLIGQGGSATVWTARQRSVDRVVALKVLDLRGLDEDSMRRFQTEAGVLAELSWNPHIVHIYDAGRTSDGRPYLATEHLSGGTLADAVAARGPLPPTEVVRIGLALADAVGAAHDAGVLHRDIKPANVLLDRRDQPRLADFGLARLTEASITTSTASFGGTVLYAAPELFDGDEPTVASDIWSLGSTLYTAATGHAPFSRPDGSADSVTAIIRRTLLEDPPTPPDSVPAPLAELILACLRKDAARRPVSAAALTHELLQLDAGLADASAPVASGPVAHTAAATSIAAATAASGEQPSSPRSSSTRRLVVAAAAAATVVALGAGAALWATGGDGPEATEADSTTSTVEPGGSRTDGSKPGDGTIDGTVATTTSSVVQIDPSSDRRPTGASNVRPADLDDLEDTSVQLRRRLDEFAAAASVAATDRAPVSEVDGPGLKIGTPPTVFDYAGVNAARTTTCARVLMDDLVVVGAAGAIWTDGEQLVVVNSVQTRTPIEARRYYWATAMFLGLNKDQCSGWPAGGVALDPTDLVVQRDDVTLPPGPDLQMSAIDDDAKIGGSVGRAYQALALHGDMVVVASVASTTGDLGEPLATEVLAAAVSAFAPAR